MREEKNNGLKLPTHPKATTNNHQFIKKIQMEEAEGILHLQVKIKGLLGKSYKLIISDNNLTISAICKLKNKGKNNYTLYTSSFFLPCNVNEKRVWSDILSGMLHIMIPKEKSLDGSKDIDLDWFNRNQFNKMMFEN